MSKNIVSPQSVSFEDALRNLASRLTGRPANQLPRTQEGIVQFMAENIPTPGEMAEAVAREVIARLESAAAAPPVNEGETEDSDKALQEAHDAPGASGGTSTPGEAENPNTEAPVAEDKPKRGSKPKTVK